MFASEVVLRKNERTPPPIPIKSFLPSPSRSATAAELNPEVNGKSILSSKDTPELEPPLLFR